MNTPRAGCIRAVMALAVGLAAASGTACRARDPGPRVASRPTVGSGNGWNVLLITIDTLRADHLGIYGYSRPTSPRIDELGRSGTVFQHAYTYWPKTRASMAMMLTGRRPSQNGFSRRHPVVLPFNATLASLLEDAGYRTAAVVDNANVAKALGYGKGFHVYREVWEAPEFEGEWAGTLAITSGGAQFLKAEPKDRPFFLWLHYVNPHAPYTPPAPFGARFLGAEAKAGPKLRVVHGFRRGIPRPLYVRKRRTLAYYVAQYDGEVAAVDGQVGEVLDALKASGAWDRTVVVFSSDHGESLGEHEYYFDHGEDLFDPSLRVPLIVVVPGGKAGQRSTVLASTLDIVPTILDAVKGGYPPDLAGESLLRVVTGGPDPRRDRLFAENDSHQLATLDARFKLVASFGNDVASRYALYDRGSDPEEKRDLSDRNPEVLRTHRRELKRHLEMTDREWYITRKRLERTSATVEKIGAAACERLNALGYVDTCAP